MGNDGRRMSPFVEFCKKLGWSFDGFTAIEGQVADGDTQWAPRHRSNFRKHANEVVPAVDQERTKAKCQSAATSHVKRRRDTFGRGGCDWARGDRIIG